MAGEKLTDQQAENLRAVYQQLCNSYLAIDDFRSKLLGFLPLISGAGISFLLTTKAENMAIVKNFLPSIGLFGFFITFGLFCFELYGIKKCTALITTGKQIEEDLGITAGQFTQRPLGFLDIVNEPFASGVIYSAVMAAWGFFAFDFNLCEGFSFSNLSIGIHTKAAWIFIGFFLLSVVYDVYLCWDGIKKAWKKRITKVTSWFKLRTKIGKRKKQEVVEELNNLREEDSALPNSAEYKYLLKVGKCSVSFWPHDSMNPSKHNFYRTSLFLEEPKEVEMSDNLIHLGWSDDIESFQFQFAWLHVRPTLTKEWQGSDLSSFASFLIKTHFYLSIKTEDIDINLQKIDTPQ